MGPHGGPGDTAASFFIPENPHRHSCPYTRRGFTSIFPSCFKGQLEQQELLEIGHFKAKICVIHAYSCIKALGAVEKVSLGLNCCITYWWEETIMTYPAEVDTAIRPPRPFSTLAAAASRRAQLQRSLLAGHPARANELCQETGC